VIPAYTEALADARLRRRDLYVYRLALVELDLSEWRELKLSYVVRKTKIAYSHASEAMKRLTQAGYIEREDRPRDDPSPRRYRLRYSPFPSTGTLGAA
jgi:DNA-binding MarR family transcriptional regulator